MKKWIAFTLSLVLIFMGSVPAFATSSIVGKLVDSDGDIASDRYDTIRPGADYYYVIAKSGTGYDSYVDEDLIRFKLQKEEGRKYIGDADLVEKKFGSSRYICIEFSVKDNFSDEEYKAVLEANFRARKDLVITNPTDYHNGNEFPSFRRATSSDGSYTDQEIRDAQTKYDNLKKEINALNEGVKKLESEIEQLKKEFALQNTLDSQQQDKIDAANQALIDAKAKLDTLEKQQADAQKEYNDALDAAKKQADQDAAAQAAADFDALKAPIEAELKAAQDELSTAQTNLATAKTDLAAVTQERDNAQTLKNLLGPDVFTVAEPKPVDWVPVTLIDRFNAIDSTNPDTIQTWNDSLINYTGATFTPLASDYSNHLDVAAELNVESDRLNQLITDANTAEADVKTFESAVDEAQQKVDAKTQELDSLVPPTTVTNSAIADLTAAEQAAQTKLDDATKAVNEQQKVVKTAEQTVLGLTTKAPADTPTPEQLLADKKVELTNKQADLRIKENAVTDAKEALDRKSAGSGDNVLESGETFTYTFKVYIQNEHIVDDDATFTAGEKGVVVKPVKNEINTVTWEDYNRTLATLSFRADSDVSFYCPRLSTRWNYYDYVDYFDDTDAYVFDFVDSPTIPATTRPTLSLYNPFVDEDGDLTVRTSRIHIYEVDDGELEDVTDDFRFERNDDDDYVMTIKTRTLGTYIVSEGRANIAERPTIEADYDDDDLNTGSSNSGSSSSGGGNSVVNNKKPVPWTGR